MKKVIIILALLGLSLGMVFAQSVYGLRAGVNFSNYSGDDVDADSRIGLNGGMIMQYHLHPLFILQPELIYTQRGAQSETEGLVLETKTSDTLHYVELPLFLKLDLGQGNLKLQPYLGPEFRYLIKGVHKEEVGDHEDSDDMENLRDFDYGLGLGLDVVANVNFMVGVRYSIGMSDIFEKSLGIQLDARNTSLMLNLGILY
jgi:hypothetical protein